MGYPAVETASSYTFIRLDTIQACDGQTDRITVLSIAARCKMIGVT